MSSKIVEFYSNKNIFITGATGFLGKVIVEKLLRDCGNINKIYLLIRTKKGVSPVDRLESFKKHQIFDRVRKVNPQALEKLKIIKGDILEEGLDISEKDRQELIDNVNIIFHAAASVRFDLPINESIQINVFGTYEALSLAEHMKNLEAFIHVSTLYCSSNTVMDEKHYTVVKNPHEIIKNRNDYSSIITPELIQNFPNTYTLSKSVAEDLVNTYREKLPVAIARPSIVLASYSEPYPGWIEGINGPTGLMLAIGKGVFRSLYCDTSAMIEAIPVDMAANAMIAMAWKTAKSKDDNMLIVNLSTADINSRSWGEMFEEYVGLIHEYPFNFSLWRPGGIATNNYLIYTIWAILFQYIPAVLIDVLLMLFKKKTFMINIQKRIYTTARTLRPFITKQWKFKTDNFINLYRELDKEDRDIFYFDVKVINWRPYAKDYLLGIKQYILKEKLEQLPEARSNLKMLYYLNQLTTLLLFSVNAYWLRRVISRFN
jgi:fatty acyl-CoA reductase